ncbi:hypothetical protein HKX48_007829 [Thoreauomyces humboldtii]|nr:hypothetical protein HKX48_007829 [Thoreauomyces humboldtii]
MVRVNLTGAVFAAVLLSSAVFAQDTTAEPVATPAAAAAAAVTTNAQCIAAKDTVSCSAFAGQSIDLTYAKNTAAPRWDWNFTGVNDIGAFDRAIFEMMVPKLVGPGVQSMYNYFGCPNWDGTGWRYRETSICGYLVQGSINCPGNTGSGMVCADAWKASVESGQAMFANTTACPQPQTARVSSVFTQVSQLIVAPPGQTCIMATLDDFGTCGFGNTPAQLQLANAFCSGANKTSTCCSELNVPFDMTKAVSAISSAAAPTPTPAVTSSSSTASSTSSIGSAGTQVLTPAATASALSTGAIVGIAAGGGVLIIALIVGAMLCVRKRRTEKELWQAHTNLVQKAHTPTFGNNPTSPQPGARMDSPYGNSPAHQQPSPSYHPMGNMNGSAGGSVYGDERGYSAQGRY